MYKRNPLSNPGVIRWRGFADENMAYIGVSIKGKRYVFSRQGDGWCCEVDLNDPDIQDVIARKYSQIELANQDNTAGSLEDLLLTTKIPDVIRIIGSTTNTAWLLDAYDELTRQKQSSLAAHVSERLAVLGLGVDGLPVPSKEVNEQENAEASRVESQEQEASGGDSGDTEDEPVNLVQ